MFEKTSETHDPTLPVGIKKSGHNSLRPGPPAAGIIIINNIIIMSIL
jgi:hypothetical protein